MGTRRTATAGAVAEHAKLVGVVEGEPREKKKVLGGIQDLLGIRSAQVETLTFKILSWGARGFDRKWNASPGIRCQASVPLLGVGILEKN